MRASRVAAGATLFVFVAACTRFDTSSELPNDAAAGADGASPDVDPASQDGGSRFCSGKTTGSGTILCADFDDGVTNPPFESSDPATLSPNVVDTAPFGGNSALRVRIPATVTPPPGLAFLTRGFQLPVTNRLEMEVRVRTLADMAGSVNFFELESDTDHFSLHLTYDNESGRHIGLEQSMWQKNDVRVGAFDAPRDSVHRFFVTVDFDQKKATVRRDSELPLTLSLTVDTIPRDLRLSVGLCAVFGAVSGAYALDDIVLR